MGSIRLQLQGQRKMAMCHSCDLCAFLVSKKQDEAYKKHCAGEAPKLKEVMTFWREITADQLDELGRSQCEIFRTDIEPGDLILIPAGMLIHERVFGSQINYFLKMGLLYTNVQHNRSVENYTEIYNVVSAGPIQHNTSNRQDCIFCLSVCLPVCLVVCLAGRQAAGRQAGEGQIIM